MESNLYHSGEIRWYFKGDIPQRVREWFEAGGLASSEVARTDRYVYLPHCETVGIKIREGRLEVKALTAYPERVSYPGGVSGLRDSWIKWSCEVTDMDAMPALTRQSSDTWIFVHKSRRLRTLSLDSGDVREVDAVVDRPETGCQVELTSIRAHIGRQTGDSIAQSTWDESPPWWSLSLEAFGEASTVLSSLDVAATRFFGEPPPSPLTAESSFSYPAWLMKIFKTWG